MTVLPTRFTQESHNGQRFTNPTVSSIVQYDDAAHAFHAGAAQGPTLYKPYQSVSQLFNMTMLPTHFTQESHRGRRFTNPTVSQFSQSVVQYDDAAHAFHAGIVQRANDLQTLQFSSVSPVSYTHLTLPTILLV